MRSMTRRRRPETGLISVAPSPSMRSKRSMSGRPRSSKKRGSPGARDDRRCRRIHHHLLRSKLQAGFVRHKARYVDKMNAFAAAADIVRMSDVDFDFLYGGSDYGDRAKSLLAAGVSLVVVTRGIRGAQAWHREAGLVEVQAPTMDVVDTIGAGDSFQAALLFALRAIGRIETGPLAQMNSTELYRVLSFATVCAAFTCGRAGADPPRQSDVGAANGCLLADDLSPHLR